MFGGQREVGVARKEYDDGHALCLDSVRVSTLSVILCYMVLQGVTRDRGHTGISVLCLKLHVNLQ